ncbi:uncharacterized protein [Rutidosis leptorrhynchoides]|uniref:uncharacterized protein n=1 Tax=Rutidosis leptorrhynchoides TaxID=125765 RepID=UPI003A9A3521
MSGYVYLEYLMLMDKLESNQDISRDLINSFWEFRQIMYRADEQNKYSKPMPWIGMYIAFASLFIMSAVVADLLHGLKNKKLWFSCKYFTLNAASLTVIAVAMKLPVDLTTLMPGEIDQYAKLGSMSFMCTMMANMLPSLATMDNNELVTNIIALGILVITVVVNVCIEITTGVVISIPELDLYAGVLTPEHYYFSESQPFGIVKISAIIYVVILLMLLIIHTSSASTLVKSKQLLESKYQSGHETALKDLEMQQKGILTVEKLKHHLKKYWIMAGTGSPQFMTVCSVTTSASGVICASSTFLHIVIMIRSIDHIRDGYYESDYKWSTLVILITQFIAVLLGTIAPVSRCFANLSFELSIKWIWSHIKVFKVESYWTQKLCDWKQSSIPFFARNRKIKIIIKNLKILILNFCIIFQKIVVVTCKTIALIPTFFVICVLYCSLTEEPHNSWSLPVVTLTCIAISLPNIPKNRVNLMKLLERSKGFEGVENFDNYNVSGLLTKKPHNSWSLPVVTLTSIVASLPNIQKNRVDSLLKSVSEGLVYVTLVEEVLNGTDEYVGIKKAADMLWQDVEDSHKWLGINLQNHTPRRNTVGQILQWFKVTSEKVVAEVTSMDIESANANSIQKFICANSMYRISETMLLSYHTDIDQVSEEELFEKLSSLISDILAACLTNLPQVISIKCHESAIEKREASVSDVVKLLGKTEKMISGLQEREIPDLNPDDFRFIDKWRAKLRHTSP